MIYEDRNGLRVASYGPVVIGGVLHRAFGGFVFCEPTLNRQSWDFTMFYSVCPICYPGAVKCSWRDVFIQGELF